MNDEFYRSRIRKMLTEFTADVLQTRCTSEEREEMLKSKGFNTFIDDWIMKHFPFEMGEEKQGHC